MGNCKIFSKAVLYRATGKAYSVFLPEHESKTNEEKAVLLRSADSYELLDAYGYARKIARGNGESDNREAYEDAILIEREIMRRLSIYDACSDAVLHR